VHGPDVRARGRHRVAPALDQRGHPPVLGPRTTIEKITVIPPPCAAPPSAHPTTRPDGTTSSPTGSAAHTSNTTTHGEWRTRSSAGTPNAPTTAAIWKTDELSPDVVRHCPVGEIVDAYARFDAEQQNRPALRSAPRTGPPQNRAERRTQR